MKDAKEGTLRKDDAAKTSSKKMITMEERKDRKIRRSRDSKWTRKNNTPHFGNKLHTVRETDLTLMREFVVTTASFHDSLVDLSLSGIVCSGIGLFLVRLQRYQRSHGQRIRRTSHYNWTDKEKSQDNKETFLRGETIFCNERDHAWRPYFRHLIQKVQGQGMNLCLGYNTLTLIALKKQGSIA